MSTETINICCTLDASYTQYGAIMLRSLALNTTPYHAYEIAILGRGLGNEEKDILRDTICDKANISVNFIDLDEQFKDIAPVHFRLLIPDMLAHTRKVLFVDMDTLVCRDVAELYNIDLEGKWVGAVLDYPLQGRTEDTIRKNTRYMRHRLGIENPIDEYFNAGVMVLDTKKLRENGIGKRCLETIKAERKYVWEDQDVLNMLCYGNVKLLDMKWNVMVTEKHTARIFKRQETAKNWAEALFAPGIVHFAGVYKPWKCTTVNYASEWWLIARNMPFYEEIMFKAILECVLSVSDWAGNTNALKKESVRQRQLLRDVLKLDQHRARLKALRWKIFFSIGEKRRSYLAQKIKLKTKIKEIEKNVNGI